MSPSSSPCRDACLGHSRRPTGARRLLRIRPRAHPVRRLPRDQAATGQGHPQRTAAQGHRPPSPAPGRLRVPRPHGQPPQGPQALRVAAETSPPATSGPRRPETRGQAPASTRTRTAPKPARPPRHGPSSGSPAAAPHRPRHHGTPQRCLAAVQKSPAAAPAGAGGPSEQQPCPAWVHANAALYPRHHPAAVRQPPPGPRVPPPRRQAATTWPAVQQPAATATSSRRRGSRSSSQKGATQGAAVA